MSTSFKVGDYVVSRHMVFRVELGYVDSKFVRLASPSSNLDAGKYPVTAYASQLQRASKAQTNLYDHYTQSHAFHESMPTWDNAQLVLYIVEQTASVNIHTIQPYLHLRRIKNDIIKETLCMLTNYNIVDVDSLCAKKICRKKEACVVESKVCEETPTRSTTPPLSTPLVETSKPAAKSTSTPKTHLKVGDVVYFQEFNSLFMLTTIRILHGVPVTDHDNIINIALSKLSLATPNQHALQILLKANPISYGRHHSAILVQHAIETIGSLDVDLICKYLIRIRSTRLASKFGWFYDYSDKTVRASIGFLTKYNLTDLEDTKAETTQTTKPLAKTVPGFKVGDVVYSQEFNLLFTITTIGEYNGVFVTKHRNFVNIALSALRLATPQQCVLLVLLEKNPGVYLNHKLARLVQHAIETTQSLDMDAICTYIKSCTYVRQSAWSYVCIPTKISKTIHFLARYNLTGLEDTKAKTVETVETTRAKTVETVETTKAKTVETTKPTKATTVEPTNSIKPLAEAVPVFKVGDAIYHNYKLLRILRTYTEDGIHRLVIGKVFTIHAKVLSHRVKKATPMETKLLELIENGTIRRDFNAHVLHAIETIGSVDVERICNRLMEIKPDHMGTSISVFYSDLTKNVSKSVRILTKHNLIQQTNKDLEDLNGFTPALVEASIGVCMDKVVDQEALVMYSTIKDTALELISADPVRFASMDRLGVDVAIGLMSSVHKDQVLEKVCAKLKVCGWDVEMSETPDKVIFKLKARVEK